MTVISRAMGRPKLSKKSETVFTAVRLTEAVRARIIALVGDNQMARFIREAIDEKLARHERAKAKAETGREGS